MTFPNGKLYIGYTKNLKDRKRSHRKSSKKGMYPVNIAVREFGYDNITWEILSTCDTLDEIEKEEIRCIAELKPEYNIESGGRSSKMADETKVKLSKAKTGKSQSLEHRQKSKEGLQQKYEKLGRRKKAYISNKPVSEKRVAYCKKKKDGIIEKILSVYENGMGVHEISELTGISKRTISKYSDEWRRIFFTLNPEQEQVSVNYKDVEKEEKDLYWFSKANGRKIKRERIQILMCLDTKNKTVEDIAEETGLKLHVIHRLHRVWEDIIEEEGF